MSKPTISGKNFKYYVEYDYDTFRSCRSFDDSEDGYNPCSDYCRCGVIENARVIEVNFNSIVNLIYETYHPKTEIFRLKEIPEAIKNDLYFIDRICRNMKIWDPEKWEVNAVGGYYGQEIGDVTLIGSDELAEKVEKLFSLTTLKEKVEFVLTLEYGYILPELKDANYEIVTIDKSNVLLGSEGQYRKVSSENLEYYSDKNYDNIRGIVIPKDGKYRLIDGYHRILGTDKKKVTVLSATV